MIQPGSKLDTKFMLDVVEQGEPRTVEFGELLDQPTIVSVYMRNNTSSCDRQVGSLVDEADWFAEKGYRIIALSKDTTGSHRRYAQKLGVPYTLASDPENRFAEAADAMVEKKMYGKTFEAPSRSAFVIDTDGTILGVVEKVDTKDHAGQVRELVETL